MVTWEQAGEEWLGKGNYMNYRVWPDKGGFRAEQVNTKEGKWFPDLESAQRWCRDHNAGF